MEEEEGGGRWIRRAERPVARRTRSRTPIRLTDSRRRYRGSQSWTRERESLTAPLTLVDASGARPALSRRGGGLSAGLGGLRDSLSREEVYESIGVVPINRASGVSVISYIVNVQRGHTRKNKARDDAAAGGGGGREGREGRPAVD